MLATAIALLCAAEFAAAIPRQLAARGHMVTDQVTGRRGFGPRPVPTALDGTPECEIHGDGPFPGQENLLDAFQGPGTCDKLIASGEKSCAHWFCPHCNDNGDCDKSCGFCESTADEPVDLPAHSTDPSCLNDEGARAAADPFKNEISPFTQGCAQIAVNGYCEDWAYIELGVLTFCCDSCRQEAEKNKAGDGVCDFMAVVNGCQDPHAVAAMHSGDIRQVCNNACALSVMENWETCLADSASDFSKYADQLEPVVTGCRSWNNGGHYDAAALAALGEGQ